MKRKITLPIIVAAGICLCIVVMYIAVFASSVSADEKWAQAGGARMKIDMENLSIMGFSQQDEWLHYYYDPQGLQLDIPAKWNIDTDSWKQPLRVKCTEAQNNSAIYVYLSRNPKDFVKQSMADIITNTWGISGAAHTTETIHNHEWQVIDGTCEWTEMQRCRLYTTTTPYWGMVVVYMATDAQWDDAMISHVMDSVNIYKNYDNVDGEGAYGARMIYPPSGELPPWEPVAMLRDMLPQPGE